MAGNVGGGIGWIMVGVGSRSGVEVEVILVF